MELTNYMPYKDPQKIREYQKRYRKSHTKERKNYNKQYRENNLEKLTIYNKKYAKQNPEKMAFYNRKSYLKNKKVYLERYRIYYSRNHEKESERGKKWRMENREKNRARHHKYNLENRKKRALFHRKKYTNNIQYRLTCRLRTRLWNALVGNFKSGSAVKDLGCTISELKLYLEGKFAEGMSWGNYGEWHIDHIIPLASFNLEAREQFLIACHYMNLQPLWKKDNLSKGNKKPPV